MPEVWVPCTVGEGFTVAKGAGVEVAFGVLEGRGVLDGFGVFEGSAKEKEGLAGEEGRTIWASALKSGILKFVENNSPASSSVIIWQIDHNTMSS